MVLYGLSPSLTAGFMIIDPFTSMSTAASFLPVSASINEIQEAGSVTPRLPPCNVSLRKMGIFNFSLVTKYTQKAYNIVSC